MKMLLLRMLMPLVKNMLVIERIPELRTALLNLSK
jgi:hypothetical protein